MNKATKTFKLLLLAIAIFTSYTITAQVGVNTDGSSPDGSAMLDVKSTTKGVLIPRMSQTEIELIVDPANGLFVFNTTDDIFYVFIEADNEWKEIAFGAGAFPPTWLCGDLLEYDGKSYATVQKGTQCWMAENLNVGTMINGSSNQTDNNIIEKYCYGNSSSDCDTYGALYQWNEMMQYSTIESTQGVCPTGWHLPSDAEWMTLEEELGMCTGTGSGCSGANGWRGTNEGSKMAGNAALWNNGDLETDPAFGTSGLDVLPAGRRDPGGSFNYQGYYSYLWSSSEDGAHAWSRPLGYDITQVHRDYLYKDYGFSVRCVRD